MGVTYVDGQVRGAQGKQVNVRFLVDSGATYSLLAEEDWKAIGLAPKRTATFHLADGTQVERNISECHITLPHGEGHTPVILGVAGDEPLLGIVTWKILGLVLNPFNRTLQPMRLLLACSREGLLPRALCRKRVHDGYIISTQTMPKAASRPVSTRVRSVVSRVPILRVSLSLPKVVA